MTIKAEYQYYAGKCLQWAAKAKDEAEQRAFLEMADAWTRAALVQRDIIMQFAADTICEFGANEQALSASRVDLRPLSEPVIGTFGLNSPPLNETKSPSAR